MNKNYTPSELLEFIKEGKNVKEISLLTNLSESNVASKLREVNYREIYKKKDGPQPKFSDEYILELFNSGKKIKEIAKITSTDQSSIGRRLRRMGVDTRLNSGASVYSDDFVKNIVSEYLSGKKSHIIKKEYGLSENMVIQWVRKAGHDVITNPQTIELENEKFFETSTPESAYFMGLFITDGGFRRHSVSIYLKNEDEYILRKLKKLIGSNHKFFYKDDGTCGFAFTNRTVSNFFINTLGLPDSRKTYRMGFPEKVFSFYEDNLSHLLRGIIDGDGMIRFCEKYFHTISVCSYSEEFCINIKDIICDLIGRKCGSINKRKDKELYDVRFSGGRICRSIIDIIYKDSDDLRLERKFKKALLIKNHLKNNKK